MKHIPKNPSKPSQPRSKIPNILPNKPTLKQKNYEKEFSHFSFITLFKKNPKEKLDTLFCFSQEKI
jgi:hypothetical protein